MDVDFFSREELKFSYVDQNNIKKSYKHVLHNYLPTQTINLNFRDVFEEQQSDNCSLSQQKKSQVVFFPIKSRPVNKEPHSLTTYLKQNLGNLKSRRKISNSIPIKLLKTIQTVYLPDNEQELLCSFLKSNYFQYFIKVIVLLNIIAVFIVDYSFRVQKHPKLHIRNIISLHLQLYANCVFTLQIFVKIYSMSTKVLDPFIIINIVGTLACWVSIFFDMIEYDQYFLFQVCVGIRIIRAIIKIFENIDFLRVPFEIFVQTILSLQKVLFPLLVVIVFYAIGGVILFSQATSYRCQKVVGNQTFYDNFCGSKAYECPAQYTCVYSQNPSYQSDKNNQYGLISFQNIQNAILTVFHSLFNSNFLLIRSKFASYVSPYISNLYFISLSIMLYYIFSNLILISMSKIYSQQVKNNPNQKIKSQPYNQTLIEEEKIFSKVLNLLNILVIVIQSILICLTHKNMSDSLEYNIQLLDFIFVLISVVIIIGLAYAEAKFLGNIFNTIDMLCLLLHFIGIVVSVVMKESVINDSNVAVIVLKSLKIFRLVRALYYNANFFQYQKIIIKIFLKTISKTISFLFLCLSCVIMFKCIGELLFAYKITSNQLDKEDLSSYQDNFQTDSSSIFSVLYVLFNQVWTLTMYRYYRKVGISAIFFFTVSVFLGNILLLRMYVAVFLCYFKKQMNIQCKSDKNRSILLREQQNNHDSQVSSIQPSSEKVSVIIKSDSSVQYNDRSNVFEIYLNIVYKSQAFYYFINGIIVIHLVVILIQTSTDSLTKCNFTFIVQNICFSYYIFQTLLGIIIYGINFNNKKNYFTKGTSNILNAIIILCIIGSFLPFGNQLVNNFLRRLTIAKIFTLFRKVNKEMEIMLDTIFDISKRFFSFVVLYAFFLLIISVIPLKMLVKSQIFDHCVIQSTQNASSALLSRLECQKLGGNFISNEQQFSNIFGALSIMYQLISGQSWTLYLRSLWLNNRSFAWHLFFIVIFFIYNIYFLNILLGFIIQTYSSLKQKAYNLNQLKKSQKGWILLKNKINSLLPKPIIQMPSESSQYLQFLFKVINYRYYKLFINLCAIINIILFILDARNDKDKSQLIYIEKDILIGVNYIDYILQFCVLKSNILKINNYQLILSSILYLTIYWLALFFFTLTNEDIHIMNFFVVIFLFWKCITVLLDTCWGKYHLNAVLSIIPSCTNILKVIAAIFFFYAALGLQLFKYIKPDKTIDNYNIGFHNIFTSFLTLIQIAVSESWYKILSSFIKHSTAQDICQYVSSFQEAQMYKGLACGSWIAYPYFLSFHIIMVFFIINFFVATISNAFDDNYEIQSNSVNIFQLEDCVNLWQKYDPQAKGVIGYKNFWKLTSEIAILFGISKKKLIKRKNRLFEQLDLKIYHNKENRLLCYRFHDVISKFSQIKLQITSSNSKKNEKKDKQNENSIEISFDISSDVMKQIKDYIIPYPEDFYQGYIPFKQLRSGQTKYIFGLLKKMRQWKHIATNRKRVVGGNKFSCVFDFKASKRSVLSNHERLSSL